MKSISEVEVKNKTVFLRTDFNVPMKDGKIVDDNRIDSALPTLNYLIDHKAKVILGTHIGRPDGVRSEGTSILPIAKRLSKLLNRKILYVDEVTGPKVENAVGKLQPGDVLVLANLRWEKGEEENDPLFARTLASYAELYINDAFAVSPRANASVEAITKYLPSYAGSLLDLEVTTLNIIFHAAKPPFVAIIGGAKIKDKAEMVKAMAERADTVLIGGAVANTFLMARGDNVGDSLVEPEMIDECRAILNKYSGKIVLPVDTIKTETAETFKILDIGPETVAKWRGIIGSANTILWNGNLGYTEDDKYANGTLEIAKAIGENNCGAKVVAGGDTGGFIDDAGLYKNFSFISTGGGAALGFLAGEKLPGIEALN